MVRQSRTFFSSQEVVCSSAPAYIEPDHSSHDDDQGYRWNKRQKYNKDHCEENRDGDLKRSIDRTALALLTLSRRIPPTLNQESQEKEVQMHPESRPSHGTDRKDGEQQPPQQEDHRDIKQEKSHDLRYVENLYSSLSPVSDDEDYLESNKNEQRVGTKKRSFTMINKNSDNCLCRPPLHCLPPRPPLLSSIASSLSATRGSTSPETAALSPKNKLSKDKAAGSTGGFMLAHIKPSSGMPLPNGRPLPPAPRLPVLRSGMLLSSNTKQSSGTIYSKIL